MSRPSDGFTIEELRDEFDWMFEFNSRMAERIRGDTDVHSLADYVNKLEAENAKLREERREYQATINSLVDECADYKAENAKLREQIHWLKRSDVLHVLTDQELADQQKHEREMQASITALDAENAKLRSMVHDMRHCIKRNHRCDDCDFNVGTDCLLFVNINKRMRELGVDV